VAVTGNAIVTGGAGDLGLAMCRRLRADGWHIGVLDLVEAEAARAAAQIPGAVGLTCDVTDETSCEAAVARFGDVDLLVNNAGIGRFGALHELSSADFRKVIDVNLVGPYVMAKAVAKGMIARHRGIIINITSINALTAGPGAGGYPAAKAGLAKLTEQMALEWGPLGIRANSVAPGFIDGGLSKPFYADPKVRALRGGAVPVRRLGVVDDIANAVAFLASEKASYISGHQLVVDGGVVPSLLMQLPRDVKDERR
jgi:NAD(P)-dependent dehydrogenase (short-subunit alcohol dehydrogenase family)